MEASVEVFVAQKGAEKGSCADHGTEGAEAVLHRLREGLSGHKHLKTCRGGKEVWMECA